MLRLLNIGSGSRGNTSYVTDGRTGIVLDAGMPAGWLRSVEKPDAVLITHEHDDHVKHLAAYYGITAYAHESIEGEIIARTDGEIRCIGEKGFYIGDIYVTPFRLPHDARFTLGYTFETGEDKLFVATDFGHVNHAIREMLKGSTMAMIESNHDVSMLIRGRYPAFLKRRITSDNGHLSNEEAVKLVTKVAPDLKALMLAHLSEENNAPELAYSLMRDAMGEDCKIIVASQRHPSEMRSE